MLSACRVEEDSERERACARRRCCPGCTAHRHPSRGALPLLLLLLGWQGPPTRPQPLIPRRLHPPPLPQSCADTTTRSTAIAPGSAMVGSLRGWVGLPGGCARGCAAASRWGAALAPRPCPAPQSTWCRPGATLHLAHLPARERRGHAPASRFPRRAPVPQHHRLGRPGEGAVRARARPALAAPRLLPQGGGAPGAAGGCSGGGRGGAGRLPAQPRRPPLPGCAAARGEARLPALLASLPAGRPAGAPRSPPPRSPSHPPSRRVHAALRPHTSRRSAWRLLRGGVEFSRPAALPCPPTRLAHTMRSAWCLLRREKRGSSFTRATCRMLPRSPTSERTRALPSAGQPRIPPPPARPRTCLDQLPVLGLTQPADPPPPAVLSQPQPSPSSALQDAGHAAAGHAVRDAGPHGLPPKVRAQLAVCGGPRGGARAVLPLPPHVGGAREGGRPDGRGLGRAPLAAGGGRGLARGGACLLPAARHPSAGRLHAGAPRAAESRQALAVVPTRPAGPIHHVGRDVRDAQRGRRPRLPARLQRPRQVPRLVRSRAEGGGLAEGAAAQRSLWIAGRPPGPCCGTSFPAVRPSPTCHLDPQILRLQTALRASPLSLLPCSQSIASALTLPMPGAAAASRLAGSPARFTAPTPHPMPGSATASRPTGAWAASAGPTAWCLRTSGGACPWWRSSRSAGLRARERWHGRGRPRGGAAGPPRGARPRARGPAGEAHMRGAGPARSARGSWLPARALRVHGGIPGGSAPGACAPCWAPLTPPRPPSPQIYMYEIPSNIVSPSPPPAPPRARRRLRRRAAARAPVAGLAAGRAGAGGWGRPAPAAPPHHALLHTPPSPPGLSPHVRAG